ncbi:spheroidene monooxygenase [Actinomadura craniellae]|uniref:spheroidene monooxygenase n=1 Tax=Actinomadura craniellae TaxID=2231787 RepID=UPI0018F12592|nr:spheroidene monooxygenase [Actinomadura craniellae]
MAQADLVRPAARPDGTIASFHLVRYPTLGAVRYAAYDRPVLRRTAGLAFWRVLGTGRGGSTGPGADLRRWALFAVWHDERALTRFLERSPIPARWRDRADESWHVRLTPLAARGRWGGTPPFGPVAPREPAGPVAVLTRASIRPSRLAAFHRASPAVDRALSRQDGCLAAIGLGEWPLLRQATFSLWRDTRAMHRFARGEQAHRHVIEQVRARGWYSEELFARFTPHTSEGTWNGTDPLHPVTRDPSASESPRPPGVRLRDA